ncbi:MAG: histone deacetylase [Verrucomicrobia bacterium]|nr:histone deacetylase [Verrucomicrobiota bacterium]
MDRALKTVVGVSALAGLRDLGSIEAQAREAAQPAQAPEAKAATGTAFVYSEEYLRHTLGKGHPESPERLKAIMKRMQESGLDKKVTMMAPAGDPVPYIKKIHSEEHIQKVEKQAFDPAICRLAVAGALTGVDAVFEGRARNAFCAVRPPGHHAENKGEFGFCFFGNVAIAARYAQEKYKIERVLVVDWDYHHGNGTEWAFYSDPSVMFFSTHKLTTFPGTGSADRKGEGKKLGLNINVPMPRGADDQQFFKVFDEQLLPVAEKYKPELVLVSAGFDSRKDDLLGDFAITDDGFARLTERVMKIAKTHARSRLVSVLEGGYNTTGLALAVESHIKTLLEG